MAFIKMKGQRRRQEVGDLFVFQLERDKKFRFGRIVKMGETTAEARFPGGILVYVYDVPSDEPSCEWSDLTPDRLLVPPFFTASTMWYRGYFRTVHHEPLEPPMLLRQHCFYSAHYDGYVDENDKRLDRRYEPCGRFSLARMDITESQIEEALDKRAS
ncbi:MAG TPA: Imm26 family immunity protein [Jiangellales bacterium]|nr:Imm26 family immunity protein [Jiangellales bacterium]